ncbi:AAA domain-containing protein [Deminuibacter soli]|uniref:DNA helicase n=1 Tax=Deminuibacter soli TaxID=2291815 RepID=A0A3E1NGH6_9BACT|nr:AAA domain-containing protein [Deminuibacter soli]RFM27055.1 hypothetical protein DXN05_16435 [Deminuibacter soli]
MKSTHHPTLDYWRKSLADAARTTIDLKKTTHIQQVAINWSEGIIDPHQANTLLDQAERQLNKVKGLKSSADPGWQVLDKTPVLIAPFYLQPIPEHLKYNGSEKPVYPFWVPAILTRKGTLCIGDITTPYIPRMVLEPLVGLSGDVTLASVELADAVLARQFTGKTWQDYTGYIYHIFAELTGSRLSAYTIPGYRVICEPVVAANETQPNAADSIIRLYDHLRAESTLPALLQCLQTQHPAALKPLLTMDEMEAISVKHLGQMGHKHALSVSQRQAMYHFLTQQHGDILAVNGPPGTGKTTLLQTVVANEVVAAALQGKEPRIILASSTNNQAVTNIIDSFLHVQPREGALFKRWLPGVTGFALFLPAREHVVKEGIPFYKTGDTYPGGIECKAYVADAEKAYLAQFTAFTGEPMQQVQQVIDWLQQHMRGVQQQLEKGMQLWKSYKQQLPLLLQTLGVTGDAAWQSDEPHNAQLEELHTELKILESEVDYYFKKERWWISLFSFLPFVKERRVRALIRLFRDSVLDYSTIDFYSKASIHRYFNERFAAIKKIRALDAAWNSWKAANNIQGNPPASPDKCRKLAAAGKPFFYNELETGIKNELFYYAVHYWEGRWLLAIKEALLENSLRKNGHANAIKRWQRFAMLTPCLVSNFYMAPKFFTYSKFNAQQGHDKLPLCELADLLIVDEAGQVSPEIGAASFALAKRALVVGDTQQIEPVWNILPQADYANAQKAGLLHGLNDEEISVLKEKGLLCSAGSIMKLAQQACCYQVHAEAERGMLLTEHRRCFDEIIGYCNRIAYHGLLEPMKGPAVNHILPPMAFVEVGASSETLNGSRFNEAEATAIAAWLSQQGERLVQHYTKQEMLLAEKEGRTAKQLQLHDIVGIITPFTAQRWKIQQKLEEAGISTRLLTIGTVHALQGAERPVILFSSVYGNNNAGQRLFFDNGVHMLNVAVSRAKESFILFGCSELYKRNASSYSGQLYRYIAA